MDFLINNWYVIVGVIVVLVIAILAIKKFSLLPRESQIGKLKEWLLYACIVAEKELGSGTGQVKLRYVYDMFISKFKFLSIIISFEYFSSLVDGSLDEMKKLLKSNGYVENIVLKGQL